MPPKLHLLRTRLFWLGMIPTVFLSWIWLASATRYIDIGNNLWQLHGQEIHVDFTWVALDSGLFVIEWGSRVDFLAISNDPPEKWTYESEQQEWTLRLFPKSILYNEPILGGTTVRGIAIPFWAFPLLWTTFWIWRSVRAVRKERELFLATHPSPANSE